MLRAVLLTLPLLCVAAPAAAQRVTEVPNGETVVVDGVGEVRLLGIESADESPFRFGRGTVPQAEPRRGPEQPPTPIFSGAISLKPKRPARDYLQKLVLGRTVRLEYEETSGGDDSSRAYVFVDDTLVNLELVRRGLATVDDASFERRAEFLKVQDEARANGVGTWVEPKP